jgi:hypothetical protein
MFKGVAFVLGAVCCLSIVAAFFKCIKKYQSWAIGCAALSGVGAIICGAIYYRNKAPRVNAGPLTVKERALIVEGGCTERTVKENCTMGVNPICNDGECIYDAVETQTRSKCNVADNSGCRPGSTCYDDGDGPECYDEVPEETM